MMYRGSVSFLAFVVVGVVGVASPAAAQKGGLELRVAEVGRSVDLNRGGEEFLTVTVELTDRDPQRLRRVQPRRDDFIVLAGKAELPCRWLRGGSLPDDPGRLRFTLGFSVPPPAVRSVTLLADLPRIDSDPVLEIRLEDPARAAGERRGPGWVIAGSRVEERMYEPPALGSEGQFLSKERPTDAKVFGKGTGGAAPERALVLSVRSGQVDLYDDTLDVNGFLILDNKRTVPLLGASLRRDPSRAVKQPQRSPSLEAELYFAAPGAAKVVAAVLRLHRRTAGGPGDRVRIDDLPVPGK
jgi:hypothetical protein